MKTGTKIQNKKTKEIFTYMNKKNIKGKVYLRLSNGVGSLFVPENSFERRFTEKVEEKETYIASLNLCSI